MEYDVAMTRRPLPRAARQGQLLRELAIVHQLTTTRLNRALRPLDLSMTHTGLLFHLSGHPDGSSVGEIAAAMDVNQPAASKTLAVLAARGAVTVETAPDDARRRTVTLTDAGRALLDSAVAAMAPQAATIFAATTDDELDTLLGLVAELRSHLNASADGGV